MVKKFRVKKRVPREDYDYGRVMFEVYGRRPRKKVACQYCGTEVYLDDEIQDTPEFGYTCFDCYHNVLQR